MKKISIFLMIFALVVFTSMVFGQLQKANVINSDHDVGGNGCQSCHAPHNGSVATGGTDQTTGQILLWDRGFTTVTFGVYDSPSMQNKATEIGSTTPTNTEPRLYSFLCMSCHDGVTTTSVIAATDAAAVGNPTNSAGLTNDHPVNMSHDETTDTGLNPAATVTTTLPLYSGGGTNNTVQCSTCHEPHDPANGRFLRVSNTGSALCITCHK